MTETLHQQFGPHVSIDELKKIKICVLEHTPKKTFLTEDIAVI